MARNARCACTREAAGALSSGSATLPGGDPASLLGGPPRPCLSAAWCIGIGAIHFLMAPPRGDTGWIIVQPLVWIPAIYIFSRLPPHRALLTGWGLGTLANVAIYEWLIETLHHFTTLPMPAAVAILVLFCAAAALVTGVFALGVAPIRRASGGAWPFAVAAWLVVCEHFVPQFFPYAQGAGWVSFPRVFLVAAHTGIGGVSFLVFLLSGFGVLAYELLRGESELDSWAAKVSAACGVLIFALALLVGDFQESRIRAAERDAPSLRVALVQDNLLRDEGSALDRQDRTALARRLVEQTEAALASDPTIDVVVWPEAALRRAPDHTSSATVLALTRRHDIELWTGANAQEGRGEDRRAFNAAYRVRDGVQSTPYYKNVLVPISEAIPRFDWLPALTELVGAIDSAGRLNPGNQLGVYATRWGRVAFVICYEAILDAPMRDSVNAGASLFANITYEGWFGETRELDQHLAMARAQVAQLGVPMVRAATTGITAIIDARGAVLAEAPRFTKTVLVGDVKPVRAPGLYAGAGPWFAWLCALLCCPLIVASRRGGRGR